VTSCKSTTCTRVTVAKSDEPNVTGAPTPGESSVLSCQLATPDHNRTSPARLFITTGSGKGWA
jgi:hypothetical protein